MDDLVLVDPQNNVLGVAPKDTCHEGEGILHRAFSIFVFNNKMELLLQKRADCKQLWPGFWSNSCCSHPTLNETTLQASIRRLQEELGISVVQISQLYQFTYQASYLDKGSENELCSVLICRSDEDLKLNKDEVSATSWNSLTNIVSAMNSFPELFTPWFKLEVKELVLNYLPQIQKMYR